MISESRYEPSRSPTAIRWRPVAPRLHDARKALNDAVEDGADEFTIRSLADDLANAEGDAAVMRADQMRRVKEVLTPEQLETMEQKKQERAQRMEERRERFRSRPS